MGIPNWLLRDDLMASWFAHKIVDAIPVIELCAYSDYDALKLYPRALSSAVRAARS